ESAAAKGCVRRHTNPAAGKARLESWTEVTESAAKSDDHRRAIHRERSIESESKRIIENAVARHPRISEEPGIPIPARTNPRRRRPARRTVVSAAHLDVCFRQRGRSQLRPAIHVVFVGFLVEAFGLEFRRIQRHRMTALNVLLLAAH